MKTLSRHKTFIEDMRNTRLVEAQAAKLFLYVAKLLNNEPLPPAPLNPLVNFQSAQMVSFQSAPTPLISTFI